MNDDDKRDQMYDFNNYDEKAGGGIPLRFIIFAKLH
jgi:hypothetical protein